MPLLEAYRAQNKGVLFAYSVEVDEEAVAAGASSSGPSASSKGSVPQYRKNVEEMLHSIDVAGDFEDRYAAVAGTSASRKTWVAVKLVSMVRFTSTAKRPDKRFHYRLP